MPTICFIGSKVATPYENRNELKHRYIEQTITTIYIVEHWAIEKKKVETL